MRGVFAAVETDAGDPVSEEARVLASGQRLVRAAAAGEQALAGLSPIGPKVVVERLPRLLSQFEPNGPTGLPLADARAIDGVAVGCHIVDTKRDEIATAQLAVDGQIEQGQVARAALKLQFGADQPDVARPQRRLRAGELLALKYRLPTMYGHKDMVQAGGLMTYGPHYRDLYRRAAEQLDKILRGAKPGDLPIEQPTKFEFILNLKTAKALGLTIPPTLIARADEVIE